MFTNLEYEQKRKLLLELGLTKLCQIKHMPEGKLQVTYSYYFSGFMSTCVVPEPPSLRLSS